MNMFGRIFRKFDTFFVIIRDLFFTTRILMGA